MAGDSPEHTLQNELVSENTETEFGGEVLTGPVDRALLPFYHITNGFLREIIVRGSLRELNATVDLADFQAVANSLKNDFPMWINHFLGYFLVLVIAVILALIIVISGISFCCCRRKGKCGNRVTPMESGAYIKHIRRINNGLLLILTSTLSLAAVGSFITSELTLEQTQQPGTDGDIYKTLENINNYTLDTVSGLQDIKESAFDDGLVSFNTVMDQFPLEAQLNILQRTYIQEAMNTFNHFLDRVPVLYDELQAMEDIALSLTDDLDNLNLNITSMVTDMESSFQNCSEEDESLCQEALQTARAIEILKNYRTVSNVSQAQEGIISATQGEFTLNNSMETTNEATDMIQNVITNTSSDVVDDIYHEVDEMSESLNTFTNNSQDLISPVDISGTLSYVNDTLSPGLARIDFYRFIAATVLNSLVVLISCLFFLALFFGMCGTRSADYAPCCNRGKGGNLMIAGVVTSFIVTWIIVLASGFLLIVGGLIHTEVCNNLINPDQSDDIQVLDYILTSQLDSSIQISSVLNNCAEDQPFYTAFEIPERAPSLNISTITNLSNYNFQELYDKMGELDYDITLDLISNESINLYHELESSFMTVDPNTYLDAIEENLSDINLFWFAEYLNETSQLVTDNMTAALFVYYSDLFRSVADHFVPRITAKEQRLYPIVDSAYDTLVFGFDEYVDTISERADSVDSETLQEASVFYSQAAIPELESAAEETSQQIQETGRCGTIYNSARTGVSSVCVKWLYPFNAYWLFSGTCFFIISLLIGPALYLDTLYRKSYKFNPEMSTVTSSPNRSNLQDSYRGLRNFKRERTPFYSSQPNETLLQVPRTSTLAITNPIYIPDPDYESEDSERTTPEEPTEQTEPKQVFSISGFFSRKTSRDQRVSESSIDYSQDFF